MQERLAESVSKDETPDIGNMGVFTLPVLIGVAVVVWLVLGRGK